MTWAYCDGSFGRVLRKDGSFFQDRPEVIALEIENLQVAAALRRHSERKGGNGPEPNPFRSRRARSLTGQYDLPAQMWADCM